jgi:hypothetical protein
VVINLVDSDWIEMDGIPTPVDLHPDEYEVIAWR